MKKILNIALLLAMGALAMSCTKENNQNVLDGTSDVYLFEAEAVDIAGADATKTYLGTDGLTALWTGNEVLHLAYVKDGTSYTVKAALDPTCKDQTKAIFKLEDAAALAGVKTVYPFITSNLVTTFPEMYEGRLYLKTIYWSNDGTAYQRPTAGSYDPDRDVLVSEPIPVGSLKSGEPIALNLTRPVTLLKLVPNFEAAAKELIKDTKITYADVGVWGGGHLSGQRGYDWSNQNYCAIEGSNVFFEQFYVTSGQFENSDWNVSWNEPIYLFCFPVPNDKFDEDSDIRFTLKFSNGYVFSNNKILVKAKHPNFHLDAGKVHTITFTVTADRMTKN